MIFLHVDTVFQVSHCEVGYISECTSSNDDQIPAADDAVRHFSTCYLIEQDSHSDHSYDSDDSEVGYIGECTSLNDDQIPAVNDSL